MSVYYQFYLALINERVHAIYLEQKRQLRENS